MDSSRSDNRPGVLPSFSSTNSVEARHFCFARLVSLESLRTRYQRQLSRHTTELRLGVFLDSVALVSRDSMIVQRHWGALLVIA